MTRTHVLIGIGAALAIAGGATALAAANAPGGHFFRKHLEQRVEEALDAVQATPEQRTALHAVRDRVLGNMKDRHLAHRADLDQVLAMFEADKLDASKLAAFRQAREAEMQRHGDTFVDAVKEVHKTLTPAQRRQLVDYVREHRPGRLGKAMGDGFFRHMAAARVDEALDVAKASEIQRNAIHAAFENLGGTLTELFQDHGVQMEEALTLFAQDSIDEAQVAKLRATHQAKVHRAGDAVEQAFREAHEALTAPQRRAVAQWVRAQMASFEGRMHHGH
jgi:Spy/CpxP family protein refolding chaperone